jgi:succinyl-diaminopimelate desuccinylase
MKTYDVVELTQKLIQFPSVTPECSHIIDYLVTLLEPLGFKCQVMTFQSKGKPEVRNLFARKGTKSPHICFAGHVDVVPAGSVEDWTHPPFAADIKDEILYGRGAVDMKGAIAAFIAAATNSSYPGSISLLITGDEEGEAIDGTEPVLKELQRLGQLPDMCIVGEPTSEEYVGDTIKNGRRGSLSGHIKVTGKQGHVAYPQRADNPVRPLTQFLNHLQTIEWDKGSDHFEPSNLEITSIAADNIATNVIPQNATAQFNIRFNDTHTRAGLIQKIEALAKTNCHSYELKFTGTSEPFINKSQALIDLAVNSSNSVLNKSPTISTSGGTSDARFIHQYCPVVELGLLNHTAHQVDEHVSIDDLKTLQRIYEALLVLLAQR